MGRRRVQLLLGLASGMKGIQGPALEDGGIELARLAAISLINPRQQIMEVLNALAGAEIDAETIAVHTIVVQQAGVLKRFLSGNGGELTVHAGMGPTAAIGNEAPQIEVFHLGGELSRKAPGIERRNGTDAVFALELGLDGF